ncbi:MAG: pyridoxal phosphate-dependent aminotransferase [Fimbriimonadaceae bacterium]|nr:pyridoxal phosphate-dependent aminotransferase [Fimbriimonadaceae bacterium]
MSHPGLAARCSLLNPSPTLSISAKAKAMKADGKDVLNFGAGEPDFDTPTVVCDAAVEAIRSGFTRYTPTSGIPELKSAIAAKLFRQNAFKAEPNQIVVSSGAKQSCFNTLTVLLDPGDEVILIAPYWMTYYEQIVLNGGVPVIVQTDSSTSFVPSFESIREKVTPKTKAILINSPSNPTGAVYTRETLKEIATLALRHNFWIISDEIYEQLVYGIEHTSIASFSPEVAERTITIGGCSKSFAMTGWRIGYAVAPAEVAKKMTNFQDQVTSNPNSFAQKGAVAAYTMPDDAVIAMREEYRARRDQIAASMNLIPGVYAPEPRGAFYLFADISKHLGERFSDDCALAEYLLENALVATVPGSVFCGPGHIRLSYATSREDIHRGVERIANALSAACV